MHKNESTSKVFIVSFILCAVCSILVSVSAVLLKPIQRANKELDIKKNLLVSAGLVEAGASKEKILAEFDKIEQVPTETSKGERVVYIAKDNGEITHFIFPVEGKGLWSTMYGFLALSPDFKTVLGMGFYDHGETPGLGGEITNPKWLASFNGKRAFDESISPKLEVIKGQVDSRDESAKYQIDGLSGATLTTKGVDKLIKFWLSEEGYLPFVKSRLSKEARL
ncbi:MAG: NADH:ubiquinone reductase (Na(+)-transporting) subunit C [Kiritimatiellae bacterium]|nr:NADH:ubiquinone reductase (Na(+)-transporting) subunit C [Kiritimatiellia bacterium]